MKTRVEEHDVFIQVGAGCTRQKLQGCEDGIEMSRFFPSPPPTPRLPVGLVLSGSFIPLVRLRPRLPVVCCRRGSVALRAASV